MTPPRKVLFVVASPRGRASVSETLATYAAGTLAPGTAIVAFVHVQHLEDAASFAEAMSGADAAWFFFPLYADQLPGILVHALEAYARRRQVSGPGTLRHIAAFVNCGFPESEQLGGALAVVRRFAELEGLTYLGGLPLGGGGMVQVRVPLEKQGGKVMKIRKALELAAAAVAEGRPIPPEAVAFVARPVLPHGLYAFIAEMGFRWECWRRKTDARAKPYA